jgi:hypothetical protein
MLFGTAEAVPLSKTGFSAASEALPLNKTDFSIRFQTTEQAAFVSVPCWLCAGGDGGGGEDDGFLILVLHLAAA